MTDETSAIVASVVGAADDLAIYSEEGFGRRMLADTPSMKAVLTGFRPGQEIPAHAPTVDMVVSVLSGDGRIRIGDEIHHIRGGDVATVPAGEVRAIHAGPQGMVALHVVSPPPTAADHDRGRTDEQWPEPTDEGAWIAASVRDEHRHLRTVIESLGVAAESMRAPDEDAEQRLDEIVMFLREHLLVHAEAEEGALYPLAEKVLRARGGAVNTMLLGHGTIERLTGELEDALESEAFETIPQILHSLRAIALLHLDEEEQVYLPALSAISDQEAADVARQLGLDRASRPTVEDPLAAARRRV